MNRIEIWDILRRSFIESLKGPIWKWLFGSFPALCAVLFFGKNYFDQTLFVSVCWVAIIIGSFILLRLFIRLVINSFKYLHSVYKESVYGDAIIRLRESFGRVHYYRKTPGYQDKEFMESTIDFCNGLKEIFDNVTKSNCSVSIKIPTQSHVSENTILKNLCRDSTNYNLRNTSVYNKTNHTIIGNTCFSKTLNNIIKGSDERYYINNDIPNSKDYENTSRGCFDATNDLPYKSELVHGIVAFHNLDNNNLVCHGFVCVDSDKINAFDKKYSVAIVEGVADGIYDIINERNNIEKNENSN